VKKLSGFYAGELMPSFKIYRILPDGSPECTLLFAPSYEHAQKFVAKSHDVIRVAAVWSLNRGIAVRRTNFVEQYAELTAGRVRMVEALGVLAQSCSDSLFKAIAQNLVHEIDSGKSLAYAAAQWPELNDSHLIAALVLGEKTGLISDSLAGYLQRIAIEQKLIRSMANALMLPLIAAIGAIGVAVFFIATIVPQYHNLIRSLPAGKRGMLPFLMRISVSPPTPGALFVLAGIVGSVLFCMGYGIWRFWPRLRLGLPSCTQCDEALFLARLVPLLDKGYELAAAFRTASIESASLRIVAWGKNAEVAIESGKSFEAVLSAAPFSSETVSLLILGEHAADLGRWARIAAQRSQKSAERSVERLAHILIMAILFLIGATLAFVMYALYQPIILLMQAI
jgi:type IV pilus assembly protein PilC